MRLCTPWEISPICIQTAVTRNLKIWYVDTILHHDPAKAPNQCLSQHCWASNYWEIKEILSFPPDGDIAQLRGEKQLRIMLCPLEPSLLHLSVADRENPSTWTWAPWQLLVADRRNPCTRTWAPWNHWVALLESAWEGLSCFCSLLLWTLQPMVSLPQPAGNSWQFITLEKQYLACSHSPFLGSEPGRKMHQCSAWPESKNGWGQIWKCKNIHLSQVSHSQ